jgi:hypothetical protein
MLLGSDPFRDDAASGFAAAIPVRDRSRAAVANALLKFV